MKKGRSLQIINRDLKSLIKNTRFIKWDGRIRRIKIAGFEVRRPSCIVKVLSR